MSLREKFEGIKSKYVKTPNGRILLNTNNLSKLSDMASIDLQGFEDQHPETVDQLNEMIANSSTKKDKKEDVDEDDVFDFSKATKKQIAKKAKENFDVDLEDVDTKDVADVRKEYEFLLATSGNSDDDTGTGSN